MNYKEQIVQLAEKLGVEQTVVEEIGAIVESAIAIGIQEREQELTVQVEESAREAAELVAEQRVAMEAEVKAHAEEVARQFVAENRERFVQTEQYDNMVQFVDQIKEAFAAIGIGTDNLDKVASLEEEVSTLKVQLKESQVAAENATAATMLRQMIDESDLSFLQQERVMSLIKHIRPDTLSEFRSIVENIISEVKKTEPIKDETEDEDDKEEKKESKSTTDVSERMQGYLRAAKAL